MKITLTDLGKKYNREWVFRHLNFEINPGDTIAITGHNGSGKSTLLKVLGGYLTPSQGKVTYGDSKEHIQTQFGFAAPYLNLLEEFTLKEHLAFHNKFKKALCSHDEMLALSNLAGAEDKLVKDFSSGMKQRLRLVLAFFYESSLLLLDEPTSNLDQDGTDWYLSMLQKISDEQTMIIASNQPQEYAGANQIISIENFKPRQ